MSTFFSLWDEERVPGKINVNMWSKIIDASKFDEHGNKIVTKSLHIQRKMLFKNKHKQGSYEKKRNL